MRSKFKKAIAGLLVLMLLVASIPISAMAKDADYKAEVNIKLAVVDLDPAITTANLANSNVAGYRTAVQNAVKNAEATKGMDINGSATTKEEIAAQAAAINSIATISTAGDGTEGNPYTIKKGQTFILAIDLDAVTTMGSDGQAKYGLGTGSAFDITFDSGLVTHTSGQSKASYILLHDGFTSGLDGESGNDSISTVLDYYPGQGTYSISSIFKAKSTTKNGQEGGEPWKDVLNIGFTNSNANGANYIPKGATWDGYVLMTAQSAGKTKVEILQYTVASDIPGYYPGSPYGDSVAAMMMRYDRTEDGTISTSADKIPNDTGIHYTPIWIEVTDPSDDPDGTYGVGSIVNNKNKPNISKTEADDNADQHVDYLKFPNDEKVFQEGDKVLIYKVNRDDAKPTYGALLGETTIKTGDDGNLVTVGGSLTAPTYDKYTEELDFEHNDLALKLVDDDFDHPRGTVLTSQEQEQGATVSKSFDGSYLKGETEVWLARQAEGQQSSEPNEDLIIQIAPETVNDEKVQYFDDDLPLVSGDLPGSEKNPLEIHVGDTYDDVINALYNQGTSLSTSVYAPVESGEKYLNTAFVKVETNWLTGNVSDLYIANVMEGADGVFTKHGTFTIRNPFVTRTVNGTTYKQPETDNYYTGSTAPVYGSTIYVKVVPNPVDYYLLRNDANKATLYITGNTKLYMKDKDQIRLYPSDELSPAQAKIFNATSTQETGDKNGVTNIVASTAALEENGNYWLTYTNNGYSQSAPIEIRAMDGSTAIVMANVEADASADWEETASDTEPVENILTALGDDVSFTVLDPTGVAEDPSGETEPQIYTYTLSGEMLNEYVDDAADFFKTDGGTGSITKEGSPVEPSSMKNDEDNTVYVITIPIPESATYNELDSVVTGAIDYENPEAARVLTINATKEELVQITGPNGNPADYHVTENKPLAIGQKDTLVISNDTSGSLYDLLDAKASSLLFALRTVVSGQEGEIVSTAVGSTDATWTTLDEGVTYNYEIKFQQTARDYDTELELFVTNLSVTPPKAYSLGKFHVDKQEEYAIFRVEQPAPETVQLLEGTDIDKADSYTATTVFASLDKLSKDNTKNVTGPMIYYGYYKGDAMKGEFTPDPDATYPKDLVENVYAEENWTVGEGDFVGDPVKLTLKNEKIVVTGLEAKNQNTADTAEPNLPINKLDVSEIPSEITQGVEVVTAKYDDDADLPLTELIGTLTTIHNNPYPLNDTVEIQDSTDDEYQNVIVTVYAKKEGDVLSDRVGSVELGKGSNPITIDLGNSLLNAMGDELYFVVSRNSDSEKGITGLAPSDPVTKAAAIEPYVLWSDATIDPDEVTVSLEAVQEDGTVKAELVEARLPQAMTGTAVHLMDDPENPGQYKIREVTGATHDVKEQKVTVSPDTINWYEEGGETEMTDTTFTGVAATNTKKLTAKYDVKSVTEAGDDPNAPKNEVRVWLSDDSSVKATVIAEIEGVTQPEGYNTADVTVTFSDEEETDIPTGVDPTEPEKYVTVTNDGDKDHPEWYTITIDLTAGGENSELTADDYKDLDVLIHYPDPDGNFKWHVLHAPFGSDETPKTVEIKHDTNGVNSGTCLNTDDLEWTDITETYKGLYYKADGFVYVHFLEHGKLKSEPLEVPYAKYSGGETLVDTRISTLSLSTGMVLKKADLVNLVKDLESKTFAPKVESGNKMDPIALQKNSGAVEWKLVKTTGSGDSIVLGAEVSDTLADDPDFTSGWAKELSKLPTAGGYALTAEFDAAALQAANIDNPEADKKVAFVEIELYNNDDTTGEHANPLQLTDGNSDIWNSLGKVDSGATAADKTAAETYLSLYDDEYKAANDDAGKKAEVIAGYRTDLVFYYNIEGYYQTNALMPDYVAKYVDPAVDNLGNTQTADYTAMIASVDGKTGTELNQWLTSNDVKVEITEEVIGDDGYGKNDAQLYNLTTQATAQNGGSYAIADSDLVTGHIQPKSGNDTTDYYNFNEKTSWNIMRGEEYYRITYKITVGDKVYTAYRNVKLRYKTGDVDLDINVNTYDSEMTASQYFGSYTTFIDKNGQTATELLMQLMDVDLDLNANTYDSSQIASAYFGSWTMPAMRF